MKRKSANDIVNQYINRIYAFVNQRISNKADVEDVTQEIVLNLYKALCVKEVESIDGFVWTVARNTLTNYYRGKQKHCYNISIEHSEMDFEDDEKSLDERMIEKENHQRIRKEIAYLSKMQRKILIMYYYEEKKQTEIAELLDIPLGTVKWHLNVAKDELKKGMEKMRRVEDLKFNPVEFDIVGLSGWCGEIGEARKFVRSALSQNILYCIKNNYMSIEAIADTLGVSPVYVESEIEFLERYQLVVKNKNKYICNIIIEENTKEDVEKSKEIYSRVSSRIANELFDKIMEGEYLASTDIMGPKDDSNFVMWSLIFYLMAVVEGDSFKTDITFEQAATIREDGGTNIITATIDNEHSKKYIKEIGLDRLNGPCWNSNENVTLWLIDADWTEKRVTENYGGANSARDLSLLKRFVDGEKLSVDEYTFLLEKHYVKKEGDSFELAIIALKEGDTKQKLFELTREIKDKVLSEEKENIDAYKKIVLEAEELPESVRVQKAFTLQYMFYSDGLFMVHARKALEESGRLVAVEGEAKYRVTEMLIMK